MGLCLLAGAVLLAGVAMRRGAEYDESYTFFLALGTPRPAWPADPFTVEQGWRQLAGASTPVSIATDLRATDVHPPLYFWTVAGWRFLAGTSLPATRAFSVLCAIAALGLTGAIARRLGVPAAAAMAITLGCYGFAYTGAIARGFALAQLLNLAGICLLLRAERPRAALAAGLALGFACLTNYLAALVGAAALAWGFVTRPRLGWAALAGFLACMPAVLWFFLAQRGSRAGQFPPFELLPSLARLARYAAANIVGGLPLYAGAAGPAVGGGLGVGLLALAALVLRHWWRRPYGGLLGLCAAAPVLGLLALGLAFDNTPIELRYLAFATPFAGLLFAALPRPVLAALLAVQALSLAGLMVRPETMQPHAATARSAAGFAGAEGLVLLPRGNDGVGIVGAFLLSAPASTRLLLVPSGQDPARLRTAVGGESRLALALVEADADSRAAVATMRAAFAADPCWRETARAANLRAYQREAGACSSTASN